MEKHNKDMHPDEDTLRLYPRIRFLIDNNTVQKEFDKYEADAARFKKLYHYCGQLAVWLTTASAAYSVAFVAIGKDFPAYLSWIAIAVASFALTFQAYLFLGRPKTAWLKARFGAERVRSLKFQAFLLLVGDNGGVKERVETFCKQRLVRLKEELNRGEAALTEFIPSRALYVPKADVRIENGETLTQARDAYRNLRLEYQKGFADSAERKIESATIGRALSDSLFVLGTALVLFVILDKLFGVVSSKEVEAWLEMVSVIVFILSAALSITEKASIAEISKARYYEYATALDHVRVAAEADGTRSLEWEVTEVEELALRELQQFSVAALLTSYRL